MSDLLEQLRAGIGIVGPTQPAPDPVNAIMIRHWCEAMDEGNPNFLDEDFARSGPHGEIVSPPAMLNAWIMPGLRIKHEEMGNPPLPKPPKDDRTDGGPDGGPDSGPESYGSTLGMLDEAGYIGVVATNSEHTYNRYLRLGEVVTGRQQLVDVSEEKQTALGIGHFVTTETEFHTAEGDLVGSMLFRILKFRPHTGRGTDGGSDAGGGTDGSGDSAAETATTAPTVPTTPPQRPRPSMNQDTQFFWDGAANKELRIQQCQSCQRLQHPPGVRCPACGSMDMGWIRASGKGKLYSHCQVHHPPLPAFGKPPIVGLVELDEGTRLVSNITDCSYGQVKIGMDLQVWFHHDPQGFSVPLFRPARQPRRQDTLLAGQVQPGDELPLCPIPLTPTAIVATAIATRDYQDVHHDRDLAHIKGSKDIFMNILSSSGLAARYLSDWAGPDAIFRNLKIRLGAPNHPYDCMTMSGRVASVEAAGGSGAGGSSADGNSADVTVEFAGINSLGPHITGSAVLSFPSQPRPS